MTRNAPELLVLPQGDELAAALGVRADELKREPVHHRLAVRDDAGLGPPAGPASGGAAMDEPDGRGDQQRRQR
jgi:hypothetical protein